MLVLSCLGGPFSAEMSPSLVFYLLPLCLSLSVSFNLSTSWSLLTSFSLATKYGFISRFSAFFYKVSLWQFIHLLDSPNFTSKVKIPESNLQFFSPPILIESWCQCLKEPFSWRILQRQLSGGHPSPPWLLLNHSPESQLPSMLPHVSQGKRDYLPWSGLKLEVSLNCSFFLSPYIWLGLNAQFSPFKASRICFSFLLIPAPPEFRRLLLHASITKIISWFASI